jgi:hypothetical protein
MHASNVYLSEGFSYAHQRWQRQGCLTGILGGTSSLRSRRLARENGEQAAEEEILIRDRAVVVTASSKTG